MSIRRTGISSLVLTLTLACALGAAGCGQQAQTNEPAAPQQDEPLVINDVMMDEPPAPTWPNKLAGAEETVDDNGIVHGTTPDGIRYTVHGRGVSAAQADRVTLAAVGDQIASDDSLAIADRYAGSYGDGDYDFEPWYQEVGPFIREHDLRYINQETVMATGDGYSPSGYPSFNSPDNMAETIANVGFNMVNFTTNHTYDFGTYGVERSHKVWARYPQLLVAGSYLTAEDRDTVHMIERNGITFAFLAYTYGDNNYLDPDAMPNDYYSCVFDEDRAAEDIARARQVADVVIVSMHWGTEYVNEPNWQQYEWAEFLADQGVDLVIGTHAHTMQSVEYITGESGATVPVVFGLSDFVSGWTITDCIVSGIFTCDFVPDAETGTVSVENLAWHPTIEWSDGGDVYVRMIENMDVDEINANTRTPDVGNDWDHIRDLVDSVITEIPVIWN